MQQIQKRKSSVGVVRAGYPQTQQTGHSRTGMRIHNSQTIVLSATCWPTCSLPQDREHSASVNEFLDTTQSLVVSPSGSHVSSHFSKSYLSMLWVTVVICKVRCQFSVNVGYCWCVLTCDVEYPVLTVVRRSGQAGRLAALLVVELQRGESGKGPFSSPIIWWTSPLTWTPPTQPIMDHLTLRVPLHPFPNGPFCYFLYKLNGLKRPLHPLNGPVHWITE